LRSAGSELNEGVPSMRAIYRFPDVDDPALILKAFNEDRHTWSQASYAFIENFEQYKTDNSIVQRLLTIKPPVWGI
jgi:hypothetical protein